MSEALAEWDEGAVVIAGPEDHEAAEPAPPELYYGSVDEFVRELLIKTYRRRIDGRGSGRVWSAEWWRSAEAISRLDALWRAWENLRLDGTTGMSVWWRDHADHHMAILMDPDGPFAGSTDSCGRGEPLPYTSPPEGLFIDERTGEV